jgi:endonuclease YncB( thermonuclease family)
MKYIIIALLMLIPNLALANWVEMREFKGNLCYDGDTCYVTVPALPKELQIMSIRILGIDTPEIRGECESEKQLAKKARELANSLFKSAKVIEFKDIDWDKYGGRILANVYLDGELYSDKLIAAGLAKPYFGETKESWCEQ